MKTPPKDKLPPGTSVTCGSLKVITPIYYDPEHPPQVARMLKCGSCVPTTPEMFSNAKIETDLFV